MLEFFIGAGAALSGAGTLCFGLAKLRMADAWKIWAGRCDPNNSNFSPAVEMIERSAACGAALRGTQ